jgi:hypothetical protein
MDEIIKKLKDVGEGYKVRNKEMKKVYYADDAIIISEDENNLQRLLHKFDGGKNITCLYMCKKHKYS